MHPKYFRLTTGEPAKHYAQGERKLWGAVLSRALQDLELYHDESVHYWRAFEFLVHQGSENVVGSLSYIAHTLASNRQEAESLLDAIMDLIYSPRGSIKERLSLLQGPVQHRYMSGKKNKWI
jgi:hypothetical protein